MYPVLAGVSYRRDAYVVAWCPIASSTSWYRRLEEYNESLNPQQAETAALALDGPRRMPSVRLASRSTNSQSSEDAIGMAKKKPSPAR